MPVSALVLVAVIALSCSAAFAPYSRGRIVVPHETSETVIGHADDARFAFGALERVLVRTVDGNRYVDTLLLGVLATGVALFVLILEKNLAGPYLLRAGILAATGLACFGIVLSVFVREAPEPLLFLVEISSDPERTRKQYTTRFARLARHNDRVRAAKAVLFVIALLILFGTVLALSIPNW